MNTSILLFLLAGLVYSLGPDTGVGAGTVPGGAASDGTFLYVGIDGNPSSFKVYRASDLSCVYTIDTTSIITHIDTVLLNPTHTTAVLVGSNAVVSIDLTTRAVKNIVQIARSNAQLAFNDETSVYIVNDENVLEKRSFEDLSLVGSLQLQSAVNLIGITSNVALVQGLSFIERIDLSAFTLLSRFDYAANNNYQNAKLVGNAMFDFKITNFPKATCSGYAVSINRYDVSSGFQLSGSSVNITTGDYQCGGGIVSPIVQFVVDQDSSSVYVLSSTNTRSVNGMAGTVTDQTLFLLDSATMQVTGGSFQLANSGTFFSPTTWKVAPSFYVRVNGALLYSSAFLKSTEYNADTEEYYYSMRDKGEINRVVNQALANSVNIDNANCASVTTVAPTVVTTTTTSAPTTTSTVAVTTTSTTAPTTSTTAPTTSTDAATTTTTTVAPSTTSAAPTTTTTAAPEDTTTVAPITSAPVQSSSVPSSTTTTSAPSTSTTTTVATSTTSSSAPAPSSSTSGPSTTTSTTSPISVSTSAGPVVSTSNAPVQSTTTTTSSPTSETTNSPLNGRDASSSATKLVGSLSVLVALLIM